MGSERDVQTKVDSLSILPDLHTLPSPPKLKHLCNNVIVHVHVNKIFCSSRNHSLRSVLMKSTWSTAIFWNKLACQQLIISTIHLYME